jgi:ubiquinone/menaquinone biosynthesis C-methylase UbiE
MSARRLCAIGCCAGLLAVSAVDARAQERPSPHHHQHHKPHRFKDAAQWAQQFESPERDRWQRPAAALAVLRLRPTLRIADIGSATGYFTVRLARAVPRGRVWGVDIEPDMVRYLNARASKERLGNLKSILGGADDPRLPESVDLVFICNTYHHISQRGVYLRRVARRLNAGGRIAIIDFKMGKLPVGPPERERVSSADLERELKGAGFTRMLLDERTLPHQYIAIFRLAALR